MLRFKDLMERINIAKTKMGDVIKDFQDSDAPQFKGKSAEKRRQMAIAAKLEADRGVKEETDLEEGSYKEGETRMGSVGPITTDAERAERAKKYREKKMKKEEVEQTDEELKGSQHKIDANKNGKIDGHDFKILRNAKKARYQ